MALPALGSGKDEGTDSSETFLVVLKQHSHHGDVFSPEPAMHV